MEQKTMQMMYFLFYNIVYLVVGTTMLGYGIFSLTDMQQYSIINPNTFIAGAAIFIGVGVLKMALSLFGFIITFFQKKPLIAVYTAATVFLTFWTFIAAIYAFQARTGAWTALQDGLQNAYMAGSNRTNDVLLVERNLNCCGVMNNGDIIDGRSCTSTRSIENVYGQGCLQQLGTVFIEQLYSIGALGMAFGVFEGTSILVAMQHMQG